MAFMVLVLIITAILIPIFLFSIKWIYKRWCLTARDRFKKEEFIWYIEILIKLLLIDILVLVTVASFILELIRR